MIEQYIPLRDLDCERYVLGTIIARRSAFDEVRHLLTEDCFFDELHRQIFAAVLKLEREQRQVNILSVRAELTKTYPTYKPEELDAICLSVIYLSFYDYAARLSDLAARRRMHEIAAYLDRNAAGEVDDIADVVERVNGDLATLFRQTGGEVSTIREGSENVYALVNRNLAADTSLTGVPTGFARFDARSGGLQRSDLTVIAGETSSGKTSLAVAIMLSAARSGAKVAMYSMEMKKEQITARILAMQTGVPANVILYSQLSDEQLQAVDKGIARVIDLPIYFDDNSTSNIDTILASIRYMKLRHNIDGAIVDYLQILNVNMRGVNKEQQMGDVARRLKNLAKDLDIWIIALSQLNRDKQDPQPTLGRLRDSGQIAEAADTVLLIYRPEVYGKRYTDEFTNVRTEGTALIDVAKGRNIGLMKFICGFDARLTRFYDMAELPIMSFEEQAGKTPF